MPKQEQGRSRGIAPCTLTLGVRRVWVICAMAQLFTPTPPRKGTWYPFDGRLGGSLGWSGYIWKLLPPLGFE